MKHYVYQLTNTINNKIYIGIHSTDNMDDGYMGSGTALERAKNKHGVDKFKKVILTTHRTRADAFLREAELVTSDFVKRKDTYNLVVGGVGTGAGEDHPNWNGGSQTPLSKHIMNFGKILGACGVAYVATKILQD